MQAEAFLERLSTDPPSDGGVVVNSSDPCFVDRLIGALPGPTTRCAVSDAAYEELFSRCTFERGRLLVVDVPAGERVPLELAALDRFLCVMDIERIPVEQLGAGHPLRDVVIHEARASVDIEVKPYALTDHAWGRWIDSRRHGGPSAGNRLRT